MQDFKIFLGEYEPPKRSKPLEDKDEALEDEAFGAKFCLGGHDILSEKSFLVRPQKDGLQSTRESIGTLPVPNWKMASE